MVAFYLTLFPYTEMLYQQNGTEAEAVAATHDWLPSRVATLYLGALGFPLATVVRAVTDSLDLAAYAYIFNVVLLAYVLQWLVRAGRSWIQERQAAGAV